MAIRQFFNPQKEDINNNLEVIMDKIAKASSIDNRFHKIDEKNIVILKIRYFEVIKAFQKYC